jgi:hypothetical protein
LKSARWIIGDSLPTQDSYLTDEARNQAFRANADKWRHL